MGAQVDEAVEEHRQRRLPVAAGAADLLVVALDAARQRRVHDRADVGLVDAHAERDRRDDHVEVAGEERALRLVALARQQARVVRAGREVARQPLGQRLALLARRGVHDRGPARGVAQQSFGRGVARRRRRLDQLERQVRAPEAVDVPARLGDAELLGDVLLHERRGGRGQRDHRGGAQLRQPLAQHPVLGPEVVAPVRDAVRLVDCDQHGLALREHLGEAGHRQALGRDEQEVELAVEIRAQHGLRLAAPAARVDALGAQAARAELRDLVVHQRDQRRDDQRRAAARQPRQLVAERLARAGRHDEQRVLAQRSTARQTCSWNGRNDGCPNCFCRSPSSASGEVGAGAARGARSNASDGCAAGGVGGGGRLLGSNALHHVGHVALDVAQERVERVVAALDLREPRLPRAGHRGALHVGVHDLDQLDPLVGRGQHLAVARGVLAVEQGLDDRRARRGRAEPGLAHRLGQLAVVEVAARGLHRRQQARLAEATRRARALALGLGVDDVLRLAGREPGRELGLGGRRVGLEHAPADPHDRAAAAREAVDAARPDIGPQDDVPRGSRPPSPPRSTRTRGPRARRRAAAGRPGRRASPRRARAAHWPGGRRSGSSRGGRRASRRRRSAGRAGARPCPGASSSR